MRVLIIISLFLPIFILNEPADVKRPDIISKEDWQGKDLTREIETHEIKYITIHHGGVEFPEDRDPFQYMRDLQRFSQEDKNWVDIPYHFTIDLNGNIFENRPLEYPGDTNTEYDPTGHALIHVVGNYEIQKVDPDQIEAISHLSAWLSQEYDVPVDSIATHRDYSEQTVCPGEDLYKYFEDGTIHDKIRSYFEED